MSKTVLVGGSKGIGAALLPKLLEQGPVVNLSRNAPEVTHDHLEHRSVDIIQDEIPVLEDVSRVVYCPGSINLKPFRSLKPDDFQAEFDINVKGAVRVIQAYEKSLKKSGNGSIVMFSTVAVGQGMPFHASVAAAKGAVEGLVRSLAAEFAPKIRVNAIAPTITDTPLAAGLLRNEQAVEKAQERHPLKRIVNPDEIADMAAFLLSDKAASISGQVIGIDAGLSTLRP